MLKRRKKRLSKKKARIKFLLGKRKKFVLKISENIWNKLIINMDRDGFAPRHMQRIMNFILKEYSEDNPAMAVVMFKIKQDMAIQDGLTITTIKNRIIEANSHKESFHAGDIYTHRPSEQIENEEK